MKGKLFINVLIIIAIVVAIFFIYQFFLKRVKSPEATTGLISQTTPVGEGDAQTDEFLNLLLSLQKIELKGTIFDNPIFRTFRDFSTELPQKEPGRSNPFAPIGADRPFTHSTSTTPSRRPGASAPSSNPERDALLNALGS